MVHKNIDIDIGWSNTIDTQHLALVLALTQVLVKSD